MMIKRRCLDELIELGKFNPVIGIIGPRQVGKTTLAKQFIQIIEKKCIYIDLEKPSDFEKMNEAEIYFQGHQDKCIIIDEIQTRPELFPLIRASVDEQREPLRFIILGSASPDIIRDSSETLAGRISYIELNPLSFSELKEINWQRHHFFGGFPNSILNTNDKQSKRWLDDFIKTYIERDLPLLGLSASPVLVRRLWEMLAWQNGNLLNATSIGKSLGLTNHTIKKYIQFLEGAFMVKTLEPYSSNVKKRIVKSPKIFISDTGILHRLMRINHFDELLGMPFLGASFESYVLQQVLSEKPDDLDVYFYRTHTGTEIDLLLTKAMKPVSAIEIKFTSAPKITKGFHQGIKDLKTKHNYIIVPESEKYPLKHHVSVCGLKVFLESELQNIVDKK
ncbi:MAG: ATP-binding protein [Chitinophagaceae bacterium]|nr:MAG: ATP-binding protein [Chitinophagaceae bacterium]